jgi:hypothetical protein
MKNHSVTTVPSTSPSFEVLLAKMMPHFRYYAKWYVRCRNRRIELDDVMQDLIGFALENYRSLIQRGKEVFYSTLMRYAMKRYQDGRRFTGMNTTDIFSDRTQIHGRSKICQLSDFDSEDEGLGELDFMEDRRQLNPAEVVQWRIDYEEWLAKQSEKDRRIILDIADGETGSNVAKKYNVSKALIGHYRKRYTKSWNDFIADKNKQA